MPQLLERKRDSQAHLRMSIAYRVFLWGKYSITEPRQFVAICQRTHQTTRYNLPVDSQTWFKLRHRTARHLTVFFVISFILLATICLICDRIMIIGCKTTQFFRYRQTFSTIFHKYFWE